MSFKKTFLPALILAAICLLSALALAFTNDLTEERIAKVEEERYLASVARVLPEGAVLTPLEAEGVEGFAARDASGALLGYAIKASAKGYGGDVTCVVGFSPDGRIIGLSVFAPDETPGLGSNVQKPEFTDQFKDKTAAPVLGTDVDGVTSATYSSRAVTAAVAEAMAKLEMLTKGA